MIRILHTADVQIDATLPELGTAAARRRNDLLHTFEHMVALAIRENVHLFLVSGNLFATPRPEESAVQRVSTALRRLTARGILPVLLPGDCDGMVTPDSVYFREQFRNLLVLDGRDPAQPLTVRIAGRTVHLYGFCQRGSQPLPPERLRLDEEGCHVALMCLSSALEVDSALLERVAGWDMDYLACAPSPQWQTLENDRRLYGCAPGSPEGYAFSHAGHRHAALVQLGPDGPLIERRRVNRRRVEILTIDLTEMSSPGELAQAVREGGHPDLLRRVVLRGVPRFAFSPETLHSACAAEFFYLEIRDISSLFEGAAARELADRGTSLGEFMRRAEALLETLPADEGRLVEEAARSVLSARVLQGGEG